MSKHIKCYDERKLSKCFKHIFIPIANIEIKTFDDYVNALKIRDNFIIYDVKCHAVAFYCSHCGIHYLTNDEYYFIQDMFDSAKLSIERNRTDWFFRPWYSASHLHGWLRFGKYFPDTTDKENLEYFTENVEVSIVDEKDLEEHKEYGNHEIIYVGMFDVNPESNNFPNVEDYPVHIM